VTHRKFQLSPPRIYLKQIGRLAGYSTGYDYDIGKTPGESDVQTVSTAAYPGGRGGAQPGRLAGGGAPIWSGLVPRVRA